MAVTKLQDKFASLRQVNSSNSQDKFQICCTDMYLVEFLANFAVFHVFLSISRDFADIPEFRGSATARNFRSPVFSVRHNLLLDDVLFFFHRLAKCGFYKLCQQSKEDSESVFSVEELTKLVNHPRITLSTELIQEITHGLYFLM